MLLELLMSGPTGAQIAPPTSLSASPFPGIALSWTNSSPSLETQVFRDGGLYATRSAGVNTYTDSGYMDGVEYEYKVRHKSGDNYSVFSNAAVASRRPPAIATMNATVSGNVNVNVTWSNEGVTSTHVRIYRNGSNISGNIARGSSPYADNGLTNDDYTYEVRNWNGLYESTGNATKEVTINYTVPLDDPTGFSATATHADRIALAWTNGDGTAQTEIYRSTSPGFTPSIGNRVTTLSAGVSAYNDDGRTQTTAYYYKIRHVKGLAFSDYVADDATTPTCTLTTPQINANVATDEITVTFGVSNPPVSPYFEIGSWSDTIGKETASAAPGITSGHVVVTYDDIVTKGTGTEISGTLTYLRVRAGSGGAILNTVNDLFQTFDIDDIA